MFDFVELKRIMRRLCDEIDHLVLLPLESDASRCVEEGDTVHGRRRREAALRVSAARLRAAADPEHDRRDAGGAADRSPAGRARGDGRRAGSRRSRWKSKRTSASRRSIASRCADTAIAAATSAAPSRPSWSAVATSAPSQPASASRARSSSPRTPPPASSVSPGAASRTRAISAKVEPRAGADARQVDHDHRADAGVGGARGHDVRRLAGIAPTSRRSTR